ncbi:hypothetical protein MB02_14160 [Croceicoccus estronivorus]|nr:hypothetical protein MB02_14160 [Croceicoccus estronivorus]
MAVLAVNGAGIALSFLLVTVLARVLGAHEYGLYSYILSIAMILAIPVQCGLPNLIVRETARLLHEGRLRQMRALWKWSGTVAILAAACVGAVTAWAAHTWVQAELSTGLTIAALALVPLLALGSLRSAALRGLGRPVQGQWPDIVLRPALLIGAAGLTVLAGTKLNAIGVLCLHTAAALLAFLAGALLLARAAPRITSDDTPAYHHRAWLSAGLFLGISSSTEIVSRNLDIIMLGILRPAAEVGYYKVASTFAILGSTVLTALNLVLQPRIAQYLAAGDREGVEHLVTFVARLTLGSSLLIFLGLLLFGQTILQVAFGTEYAQAYMPMAILAAGQLANAGFGPVMLLLNMAGHEKVVMRGVILSAVVNLVLNALLIPRFGTLGAAVATAIAYLTWNAALYQQVRVRMGLDATAFGRHVRVAA